MLPRTVTAILLVRFRLLLQVNSSSSSSLPVSTLTEAEQVSSADAAHIYSEVSIGFKPMSYFSTVCEIEYDCRGVYNTFFHTSCIL